MRNLTIQILTCFVFFYSCSNRNDRSVVQVKSDGILISKLIFEEVTDSIDLKLSDLIEEVEFIKLQTLEGVQISNGVWFTDRRYIIVFCRGDGLFQFSRDGCFIRKITGYGSGPNEILSPAMLSANESGILYISDLAKPNTILQYDLIAGKFGESIRIAGRGRIQDMMLLNDTTFVIAPFIGDGSPASEYFLYNQTINGDFVTGIPSYGNGGLFILGSDLLSYIDKEVHFRPAGSDTLFKVNNKLIPYFIFSSNKSSGDEPITGSLSFDIIAETSEYIILKVFEIRVAKTLHDNRSQNDNSHLIFFDKINFKAYYISGLINDYTGGTIASGHINVQDDNILYIPFDAFSIMNLAKRIDSDSGAEIINKDELLALTVGLTENDNPVLLLGKIK